MADVDLSAEQITVVPAKAVGMTKGLRWTKDQCLSSIELGFDYQTAAGEYLGSSQVILSDSSMPPATWTAAKALATNPAKTAEDLVAIMAGTPWGKELIAMKWRTRDVVAIPGK